MQYPHANDNVVFFSAPEVSAIQATLVRELQAIDCWLHLNSLFVNLTKTEAMQFGTSQKLSGMNQFSVTISEFAIKRVTEFTYLGVILDEHLSWNQKGGGVSRQISGLVITTSVTSRHTSVIFDMAAKFFGSLTERNVEISNFLMIRLLCPMLPRIQNI